MQLPHQAPTFICKDLITVNYRINSASRLDPLIVHRYALGSNEKQIQFCSTFRKKCNFSCFYRVFLKLWFDMTCGRIMVEIFPLFPRDWTRSYFLPCNEQILSLGKEVHLRCPIANMIILSGCALEINWRIANISSEKVR